MVKKRLIIVEDEGIVLEDFSIIVKELGYSVVQTCSTGEDAIRSAREKKPDLILMDINLHGETDGITAAKIIKDELNIPIIFLSAYADMERMETARKLSASGYLVKPIEENLLHKEIRKALNER